MDKKLVRFLCLVGAGLLAMPAIAQSNYTIANPLIGRKDAKVEAAKPGVAIARSPGATPGRPIVRAVDDGGAIPSPVVTDEITQSVGRVPGASGAKVNALRDELSVYTATAILSGSEAVLRTNVGKIQAVQAGAGAGASGGAAPAASQSQSQQSGSGRTRSSPYHQDVLRVVHGQPLMINEVQVFPYVRDLQVDFTLGKGKAIFYSVVLDSETPPVYGVPAANREPVDATVEAKRSAMVSPSGASMPTSNASSTSSRP